MTILPEGSPNECNKTQKKNFTIVIRCPKIAIGPTTPKMDNHIYANRGDERRLPAGRGDRDRDGFEHDQGKVKGAKQSEARARENRSERD